MYRFVLLSRLHLRQRPHNTEPCGMDKQREREAQYSYGDAPGPMLPANGHAGDDEYKCANGEHHQQGADRKTWQYHCSSIILPKMAVR
jgi:hypothetical protein